MNSTPFHSDPTTHPTVITAKETLREKHRSAVAKVKADYELALERRWTLQGEIGS